MAMGTSDKSANDDGNALRPSNNRVRNTVISGIPHLEVYVKDIPIRLKAMVLQKFAMKRNIAGSANDFAECNVLEIRSNIFETLGLMINPKRRLPPKRYNVKSFGRSRRVISLGFLTFSTAEASPVEIANCLDWKSFDLRP
mmetsp:Transcript_16075/g.22892  ORF Transcript_16075/g.22892 Transcript_16075/m.22892 type:complete len:141 (-) Transcript_16075:360-782(-)|eukprot:CAMPEP_0184864018 /NCGR_PEP_ID=MMETSP0580-20130426/13404_1 /TAXON_ID=1118495 /ORGANISM="Dactyliosolen fragilissimus" /LENGTH=140 /DNA_ID=CAMNT_0027362645 /DNA_START=550 /DNA_END=972 /DNA_ORIENTATION=+